jgi:hypothetical protein
MPPPTRGGGGERGADAEPPRPAMVLVQVCGQQLPREQRIVHARDGSPGGLALDRQLGVHAALEVPGLVAEHDVVSGLEVERQDPVLARFQVA